MRMNSLRYVVPLAAGGVLALALAARVLFQPPQAGRTDSMRLKNPDSASPARGDRPVVVLNHDFGLVMCGTESFHEFEVSNDGAEPWTVKSISSSCSCSVVEGDRRVIGPDETGRFQFRYRAPGEPKNSTGDVRLEFIDSSAPIVVFRATATVRNPLTPSSYDLRFEVPSASEREREIRVDNYSGKEWSNIEVISPPAWLRIQEIREIPREAPYTQSWLVKCKASASKVAVGDGYASQLLTLRAVEHEDQPNSEPVFEAVIRITRIITEEYVLTPGALQFGPMRRGEATPAQVILQAKNDVVYDTEQFIVGTVESTGDADLEISFMQRTPSVVVITSTCTPKEEGGVISGTFEITLPDGRSLKLPFNGRVIAAGG